MEIAGFNYAHHAVSGQGDQMVFEDRSSTVQPTSFNSSNALVYTQVSQYSYRPPTHHAFLEAPRFGKQYP